MKLRTILFVLALLAFLSASVGGFLYYHSSREFAFKEADRLADFQAKKLKSRVSSALSKNQRAVKALAGLMEVRVALLRADKKSLAHASSELDHFRDALGVSVCYLMDRKGNTIASSNRNRPDSFVGKNYGFRPYFQQAIQGNPAVYMALGVTSKKRGVYYSHPVYGEGTDTPIGAAVIKSSVSSMEQDFGHHREGIALLTNAHGVIFASSRKDWLYHVLWKVSPEKVSEIAKTRQFGEGPWEWIGLKTKGKKHAVDESGDEYLIYREDLDNYPGWYVTYLISQKAVHKSVFDPLAKTSGPIILVLCILIGSSVFFLYRIASRDLIQRKTAEEELNRQKTYFQHLFENSPVASVILDTEDRIVDVNSEFEELFEYSVDETRGRYINDLIVSEDLIDEARVLTNRTLEGEVVKKNSVRKRKGGSLVDVSILGYPITFNGEQVGVYAIYKDITSRKRAEKALRESETQYRNLVDNALVGVYKTDLEGNILYVNEALIRIMGFDSFEDMKSVSVLSRYSNPRDRDRLIETLTETGKVGDFEVDLVTKDGAIKNVLMTAVLEENIISGMVLDITERRQAVDESTRLATVVEQAAESVIISDRKGAIQYVNPAFERLSGFTRENIVGRNFRILKSDKHDEAFYRKMWKRISNGKTWAGRITNRMKDGSLREFETTISPIRDGAGDIVNFVSVNRDVTQEVALEAQLLHAQKMEAVGTLAGGIAHDFNNLLQVIQGYTEVLLHDANQKESSFASLNKIHRSAKRGAELTRQLLTFGRKVQSEKRPLDLNQEVEQVKNLLERTIPKMIEIELHLKEEDPIVSADPVQVEQALMNLAVNAMDAMPEGGKIIFETERVVLDGEFCKTHLGAKPGEYVLLSISDTGHGMDKEIREHVFEPFYTTKEVGKGTGLGLAMVYGIVKNHEGYILCYSELGIGTTFKIYLPILHQVGQVEKSTESEDQIKGGNETILMVDDEEYIRELGVELLSDAGYQVLTATDGKSGLELYQQEQERIDLVILDLVIPGMDGKKCYEEILKINPMAKILIVSGYSANGPGREATEAGAKGFVGKPFDIGHMLATVRGILDQD